MYHHALLPAEERRQLLDPLLDVETVEPPHLNRTTAALAVVAQSRQQYIAPELVVVDPGVLQHAEGVIRIAVNE